MKNKTLALIGASGKTGAHFLALALQAGYTVRALVRTPSKITFTHPSLMLIEGDVLDKAAVNKTLLGASVVVSLFGHVKGSPEGLQTNGTRNLLAAMKTHGISKIVSLSGGGLPYAEDKPKFADHLIRTIMKVAEPKVLNDAIDHAVVLKKSDAKWIIVRGPRLTDEPAKGTYRVGWVGVNSGTKISRADLAAFILTQIGSDEFTGKMPFVSE